MPWVTKTERLKLRAGEIICFYEKSLREGPLPHADQITTADIQAAKALTITMSQGEAKRDYPSEWETNSRSLAVTLSAFRKNAMEDKNAKAVYLEAKLRQTEADLAIAEAKIRQLEMAAK
jgi:hypothetical protein